jgi:hypothetical protein
MEGTKPGLPPWQEVNHEINLIDNNKWYNYYLPHCPHALREELHEKINRYIKAGWWEPKSVSQAELLLCIQKKDTKFRTVIDARQRNDNTIKDVTPLLDQEVIQEDVARVKFRSKVDLSDTYEQVCIHVEDIDKTAFMTISGTYVSQTSLADLCMCTWMIYSGRLPGWVAYTKVDKCDRIKLPSLRRSGNHKLLQVENRISNYTFVTQKWE